MREVYWVEEGVLGGRCGPECAPWDVADLHAGGVRAVVSLDRFGVEPEALQAVDIAHLPLYRPMILLDTEFDRRRFLEVVPPILDFIGQMEQAGRGVLVHCYYGRDRTGCVLACCLVARRGLSAEMAIAHIRGLQPEALTAPGYAEAVELFDRIHLGGRT